MSTITRKQPKIHYPDSDGQPMADNTLQFDWIAILKWNLDYQFADDPNVFVAGDHLIYAEEGNNKYRVAPDVYVAFGRPKGHRGSYKVWEEDGIFPQVVFEVWSPSNRAEEMQKKLKFYQTHGAEEYYYVYPETPARVDIWRREGDLLIAVPDVANWVSPRTGIRFEARDGELSVYARDGWLFRNPVEIATERDRALHTRNEALHTRDDALHTRNEALHTRDQALHTRDEAIERAAKLAAKLRELGVDPDSL